MIDSMSFHSAPCRRHRTSGFTLIEIAIALLVLAVLATFLAIPTVSKIDEEKRIETQKNLEAIREALIGFAAINGRLPCPDYRNDPTAAAYGTEDCDTLHIKPNQEGYLPWKTLGMSETDAWGRHRTSASEPRTGDWRYRVERTYADTFDLRFKANLVNTGIAFPDDKIEVYDHQGKPLTANNEYAVFVVFSVGSNGQADGQNSSYESKNANYEWGEPTSTYDDQLISLGRSLLAAKMYAAGKLP